MRSLRFHCLFGRSGFVALCLSLLVCSASVVAQNTPFASSLQPCPLQIVGFVPVKPFAVGMNNIALAGVLRNNGTVPVSVNQFIARVFTLAGLVYANADNISNVPQLNPGAEASFQWTVQPTSMQGPLVAAMAIQGNNYIPQAKVIPIYHFSDYPYHNNGNIVNGPKAVADENEGVIENQRMRVAVLMTDTSVGSLFLSCREGMGWRMIGVSLPIAATLSGEGSQIPWWEVFRINDMKVRNSKQFATLILNGVIGLRWGATVTFSLQDNSPLLRVNLRLTPLKPMNLSGVRLCDLMAGNSSFGSPTEVLDGDSKSNSGSSNSQPVANSSAPTPSADSNAGASTSSQSTPAHQAPPGQTTPVQTYSSPSASSIDQGLGVNGMSIARWGNITVGVRSPYCTSLPQWRDAPVVQVPGTEYYALGATLQTNGNPTVISPGQYLDFESRIILVSPSVRALDAIILPKLAPPPSGLPPHKDGISKVRHT